MGFIDNIRMAQMFPAAGGRQTGTTPNSLFGTPQVNPPDQTDLISQFAQRILPLIHGEQDRERGFNQQDMAQGHSQHMLDIANAAANPNVVFKNDPNTIKPLDAAKLEQGQQKIDLTKEKNTGTLGLGQDKLAETKAHNSAIDKINEFKATHPGMKLISPKGGNFQALDPITGQTMDLGISTGTFNDEERINVNQKNALARIDETASQAGKNAGALETQRQGGRVDLAGINNKARMDLKTTAAPEKPLLPGQQNQQTNGRYIEASATHPEWKSFITPPIPGQTTTWSIKSPSESGGPDELTYHQIGDFIYGGAAKTEDINLPNENKPDPLNIRGNINKSLSGKK